MIGLEAARAAQDAQTSPEQADALARLHDIALPDPVSMYPQTVGWYVLGALLVLAIAWVTVRAIRRYRRNRYRREALKELDRLEGLAAGGADRVAALREVPALVKRTALSAWPRAEVAELAGEAWLRFLDSTGRGTKFTDGAGQVLLQADYGPLEKLATLSSEDSDLMFGAARDWIRRQRA